jgi:hypothetical protein
VLTPRDLETDANLSGYKYVVRAGGLSGWQASRNGGGRRDGWRGPLRKTALDAARDYCDHVNGGAVTPAKLKTAGHTGRRPRLPDDPEVQAAIGVIRDARGAQAGNQGYVYLICETDDAGSIDLLHGFGKIGFSTNPEARVAELQTGNPRKLRLCAYFPGDADDERDTQRKWIDYNVLQEWFRLTPPLWFSFIHRKDATVK